ncbi:MAG: hypothetical protein AVDCRST_MAG33-2966 [uncultured Thermomicrobiales bacterium]|uniref:Major facilitator superfamily (MFS) profile domain-containing protein n=1 Tax=uncultured Thermomicrobiales bacterium TaxID=1645740 RepID=A0A6J4VE98_9BACT|nr:MAG: hypothetical protein AVDCRST_MAG33-2966 [uncultured Thermomicrobiales bacterium]
MPAPAPDTPSARRRPPLAPFRDRLRRTSPILAFPAALVILGLTFGSVDIITPALPTVRDALGMNGTTAGLIISLFYIGRLIMSVPAGIMVDRYGAPIVAAAGGLIMATGSVLAAVSTADLVLLSARVIQGFALAMLISSFMLSVVRARPGRGVALMIINVGAGLGTVCGLIASGVLTSAFSWAAVFWAVALLSVAIIAVALISPRRRGLATHPANTLDPAIVDQNHAPLRTLLAPIGLNLIIQGAYGVFQVAFPLYAAWRFDASGSEIGTLLLVTTGTHIACSVITGRLIHRHGAAIVIPFGMAIGAVCLVGMLFMPSPLWLVPWLAPYAGGMVACNIAAQDLLLGMAGRGPRAVTLARFSTDLAQVVGPFLVGVIIDLAGFRPPIAIMAGLLALGVTIAVRVVIRETRHAASLSPVTLSGTV